MDGADNITDYYVYDGMRLVAKISGSNVYYYHYDGSTNTIAMTDSSGNMVNKYAYDEFGNLLNAVETVPNPFTFLGQYGVMDDDSGLLYMRARYYDPEVGRFINKDPIRYLGGDPNLYCYVANNPVNSIDPNGLWILQGAGAFLGAGINAYNNYGAYKAGAISGTDYALSIAIGGLTGLASSFGGGIVAATLLGGSMAALNELGEQLVVYHCDNVDFGKVGKAGALGVIAGGIGELGYINAWYILKGGSRIGKKVGSPMGHYGNVGGIIGSSAGSYFTN